jgi:predicted amidophosphoribosyltransferase
MFAFSSGMMVPVHTLGEYIPHNRQKQTGTRDELSCKMMNFKAGQKPAVGHFYSLLEQKLGQIHNSRDRLLDSPLQIAIIPSSSVGGASTSLIQLANNLATKHRNITALPLLERVTAVESAHKSAGPRSVDLHLQTIRVIQENLMPAIPVLLLDDVSTTGSSMKACYRLLQEAGARSIIPLALLKTA